MGRLRNARRTMERMGEEGRAVVMAQAASLPCYAGLPSLGLSSEDVDSRGGLPKDNGYTSAGPAVVIWKDGESVSKIGQILGVIQAPTRSKI